MFNEVKAPRNPIWGSVKNQCGYLQKSFKKSNSAHRFLLCIVRIVCIVFTGFVSILGFIPMLEQLLRNVLIDNKNDYNQEKGNASAYYFTMIIVGVLWIPFLILSLPFFLFGAMIEK